MAKKTDIWTLNLGDPDYPELLSQITDPPKIIYGRGERYFPKNSLAVIGSRRPTTYGLTVTKKFVTEWSSAGLSIISGLALGIDAAAHSAALESHGHTVAVLAGGVDKPSPFSNARLAQQILNSGGAIISEFPPGTSPIPAYFPKRNRIIAGLSTATAVIEATKVSGSLITASLASRYHRDVYAVPGEVFSVQSEGTNSLIEIGARPLTSANLILESLGVHKIQRQLDLLNPMEDTLVRELQEPLHVSELYGRVKINPEMVSRLLVELQLKGVISESAPGTYVKVI